MGTEQQEKESKSSVAKSESDHVRKNISTGWLRCYSCVMYVMALHTQTNLKLECKRVDLDMQQLRKTRDEEKQKLKVEQEVSIVFLTILFF